MIRGFSVILLLLLISALMVGPAGAQTSVTLTATLDNTLYESPEGTLSNGLGAWMFSGKTAGGEIRRALVSFDIAGNIPAGATIDSAKLVLNMSRTIALDQTISLHKVLASWGEGTSNAPGNEGSGTASTNGDATWIHRIFPSTFWTAAGGDYSATVSASRSVSGAGFYTWGTTTGMTTDVQSWLDNPATNFGWILVGNESSDATTKRFDSRNNNTVANRPALTVYYREDTGGVPCGDIFFFNAKCNSNGAAQAMVKITGDYGGETVTFTLDGNPHVVTLLSNGTNSIGKLQVPMAGFGAHTVALVDPAGCFNPVNFNCQVDAAPDPRWDAIWNEYQAMARAERLETRIIGNFPNPFNPSTTIRYSLGVDSPVSVKVFNMLGQEVATLVDGFQKAGEQSVVWHGVNDVGQAVASGLYVYRIHAGNTVMTQKMLFTK